MVFGNICKYNKYGYCKFGNRCFRRHENRFCEKEECEVKSCSLRHPRKCRFFMEYNYCKFGSFCRFRHEVFADAESVKEIKQLKSDLEKLREIIVEKDDKIKLKEIKIKELEERNSYFERDTKKLKEKIEELKSEVDEINNSRAVETMVHLDFVERAREKYGYDSNDEESEYESDEDTRTNNRLNFRLKKVEELRKKMKCDICDFTTKSEVGLKSHKTKKHKE